MKKQLSLLFILLATTASAQTALYNNGNLRIHEGGSIGFHTNLINVSPLDNNLGLAGFYGTQLVTVSGTLTPQFYDVEIALENDLQLALGIDNSNNTNFILGNIRTPLTQPSIFYTFLDNSFYTGEYDFSKIEGYAAITNQKDFAFPIGDNQFLRPLIIKSESVNLFAKSAFFFEDANAPISFSNTFDTLEKDLDVERVNTNEFWRLEGTIPSNVTLSWNQRSAMADLTEDATKIIPVGWSKNSQRWINLAGSTPVGSLNEGFITTTLFIPDDYEIITLGASKKPYEPLSLEVVNIDNFFVSVNGDGVNDSFYVVELEDYDSNFVQIYDRYGLKVFEMANYRDEFNGYSNLNNVPFGAEKGLPIGVYFYTIDLPGEDLSFQGFLYLAR